jgi:HicA toxin of bacterial toxin-antitoxin,
MKPISRRRLCKLVESRGWALDHSRGSHHIYTHPDATRVNRSPFTAIGNSASELSGPSCEKRASQTTIYNHRGLLSAPDAFQEAIGRHLGDPLPTIRTMLQMLVNRLG